MTISVERLDSMPDTEAAFKLAACCGSSEWVARMLARRPFETLKQLLTAAADVAKTLTDDDWLEAFRHHPKIGQRNSNAVVSTSAESWSAGEQSAVSAANTTVRAALVGGNADYEARFGFIFIISASGKSADEILAALRARMRNERDDEIRIAAAEQMKITRLRLEKLTGGDGTPA